MIRRTLSTLAALTLAAALTACGDTAREPEPEATDSTTAAEPSPTPTEAAWQAQYSAKQLKGYETALQRWQSYLNRSEAIWAAGKATPQAEDLFKEFFPDPIWRSVYAQLMTYEQVEVTTEGQAEVYSSKATEISEDGRSVTIEQCVNYSAAVTTQRGEVVAGEMWGTQPRIRRVHLSKPEGYGWLIYELDDATSKKRPKRCDP